MTAGNRNRIVAIIAIALAASAWWQFGPRSPAAWADADLVVLRSLSLNNLPPIPADPSNAVADDPRAAIFGHKLFFDTRLSANGAVSCATCHQPTRRFSDGFQKGRGIGLSGRNTRSIVGSAYSPWQYWDGRRDSQWAQALSPLEDPAEHGGNRMQFARFISVEPGYRAEYEALFGQLPDFSDRSRFPRRQRRWMIRSCLLHGIGCPLKISTPSTRFLPTSAKQSLPTRDCCCQGVHGSTNT